MEPSRPSGGRSPLEPMAGGAQARPMSDAQVRLDGFIDEFTPELAARARAVLARMDTLFPAAFRLVYDGYNALAIGYGSSEKQAGLIFSIALYPRWVSLFFARGVHLDDPTGRLKGEGTRVRHIVLDGPETLDDPDVALLMSQALALATPPLPTAGQGCTVIKSAQAKTRPRRPA